MFNNSFLLADVNLTVVFTFDSKLPYSLTSSYKLDVVRAYE